MSPVVKRKGERFTLPSKYLLFILTILCTIMMLVTFGTNVFNRPFNRVVGYVIVPFEQGIAKAGEWLANRSDELVQIRTLLAENSALKEQVPAAFPGTQPAILAHPVQQRQRGHPHQRTHLDGKL